MLILVVGPSGAGKDTVLRMARQALAGDDRFRFVRRVITRPAGAGGEDHEAISDADFLRRRFTLQWQAHGLRYGLPLDHGDDLARGLAVVANVSRGVIAEAAKRFPTRVIEVTAPPDILAARLAERGREQAGDIAQRLTRDVAIPHDVAIETIMNDTSPQAAADRFVAAVIRAAGFAPPG